MPAADCEFFMFIINGTLLIQDPKMMTTPNAFANKAEKQPPFKKGICSRQISGETSSEGSAVSQTHLAKGMTRGMLDRSTI